MHQVKINDLSVAYSQAGNGPALVLLQGFIIDSKIWKPQMEALSREFTVIAWDAPGAGESSDPPETFTMTDWADCLGKLLDSLDIKQAHILGLSWGGVLAQEYYHLYPERVQSLILEGTYAGWKGSLPEPIPEDRLAACMTDASVPREQFVNKYLPGMFSDSPAPEAVEEMSVIMSRFHPEGFKLSAILNSRLNLIR